MQENRKSNRGKKPRSDSVEIKKEDFFTQLDHAPLASFLTLWLPGFLKSLGVPKRTILGWFGDLTSHYTDEHRVSYEGHVDVIDENTEFENDGKEETGKLKKQVPDELIEEGGIQPLYLVGLVVSSTLLVVSFFATVIVTSTQVQNHSGSGSWGYGLSIGLISAFGSSLLKWSTHYPFADYRKYLEMLLVPVAFVFFGLFVYQLVDLYFYMEPVASAANSAPDFSKFLVDGEIAAESVSNTTLQGAKSSELVSLKWFYVGVLGTEMCASYAFLSFITTCSTLQPKAIVRAVWALEGKARSSRSLIRAKIRKARKQTAWLEYQAKKSQAPGKAIQELIKRLTK